MPLLGELHPFFRPIKKAINNPAIMATVAIGIVAEMGKNSIAAIAAQIIAPMGWTKRRRRLLGQDIFVVLVLSVLMVLLLG